MLMSIEEIQELMDDTKFEPNIKEPIIESKERTYIRGLLDKNSYNMSDSLYEIGERRTMVQTHVQETAEELKRLVHLLKELNKFRDTEPELFI